MVGMKLTAISAPPPGIVIIKRQAPLCRAIRPSCLANCHASRIKNREDVKRLLIAEGE